MSSDELDTMARLYEAHADAVHAYALRRSDRETADEVTARVFLVAWRRRASVPTEPLPWLYGVARKVLAEERRGAARRGALRERISSFDARRPAELPDISDVELAAALGRLSSRDRETLLLRYWEELSPEQVAVALGCSRATLAVRLHRARGRLRHALANGERTDDTCAAGAES
ncbi:MAG TPA: sigma-70 family RNA polymerase sigma factor [Solirubrobacteraceae bacterium]|jgi:RNA polymerase sigma-70 factor (ECF subfamily)|nr:sigma-70 family RNA polymerase sigma factor [Solirubrobacteraceae bacterium]